MPQSLSYKRTRSKKPLKRLFSGQRPFSIQHRYDCTNDEAKHYCRHHTHSYISSRNVEFKKPNNFLIFFTRSTPWAFSRFFIFSTPLRKFFGSVAYPRIIDHLGLRLPDLFDLSLNGRVAVGQYNGYMQCYRAFNKPISIYNKDLADQLSIYRRLITQSAAVDRLVQKSDTDDLDALYGFVEEFEQKLLLKQRKRQRRRSRKLLKRFIFNLIFSKISLSYQFLPFILTRISSLQMNPSFTFDPGGLYQYRYLHILISTSHMHIPYSLTGQHLLPHHTHCKFYSDASDIKSLLSPCWYQFFSFFDSGGVRKPKIKIRQVLATLFFSTIPPPFIPISVLYVDISSFSDWKSRLIGSFNVGTRWSDFY